MNRTRFAMAAFVAGACAAIALGQNAGNNSAGPTKNDYRLRVVEPAEGSTVSGSTVRVVVNTEIPAEAGDTRRDVNSMPRPDVDVFLDDQLKGTMKAEQNVLEIVTVEPGPHNLVLLAKNRANEIIDRKAIQFTSTASVASSNSTGSSSDGAWALSEKPAATATDATMTRKVEPATAPAPIVSERSTSTYAPSSPASSPAMTIAQASPAPAPRHAASPRTLPETASSDPSLLLAGAGLLLAGLLARRSA